MEAALERFRAADTQVLGVSVDSIHSHISWAKDLGGVSFPLLADFHPKGAVAASFGHYLDQAGITDRATVLIDKSGKVRKSISVTPAGKRDIDELVAMAEQLNAEQDAAGDLADPPGLPDGVTLYVKSNCGPSRRVLLALDNLGVRDRVAVRNVTDDAGAATQLESDGGKDEAPCLMVPGRPALYDSGAILIELANSIRPI